MTSIAADLAAWAGGFQPTVDDLTLSRTALVDTVSVAVAARAHPTLASAAVLSEAGRWGIAAHVLDFDDLHVPSTAHISAICVPATLAAGGDARAYLAGAGVMARLGMMLGWASYRAGWHTTCTAGAPAAAVAAGVALGLGPRELATAMAMAVPAAGGVRRAFGTDAKSIQVGYAVEAGMRAAHLAAAGATADPSALDVWVGLLGGTGSGEFAHAPAVPGGLAVKLHPCCYALQRPIAAVSGLAGEAPAEQARQIRVRTPEGSVTPLIHHRPATSLEAKFSLEYAVAIALLRPYPGIDEFEDALVNSPEVQRLLHRVEVELTPGGEGLLDGVFEVEVQSGETTLRASCALPPGSPERPPTDAELSRKATDCLNGTDVRADEIDWGSAAAVLRAYLA